MSEELIAVFSHFETEKNFRNFLNKFLAEKNFIKIFSLSGV